METETGAVQKPIRVYVIDDNPQHCRIFNDYFAFDEELDMLGYSLNPREGVELVKELEPDIVLIDNVMPDLDGVEVLKLLGQHRFNKVTPKYIMISSSATDAFQEQATRFGASYCMSRYIDVKNVASRIKAIAAPPISMIEFLRSEKNKHLDLDMHIAKILHNVGVPAHIKGYGYLKEGIAIVVKDPTAINYITKKLYPEVAQRNGSTSQRVERSMRHAIETAWNRANVDVLDDLFGYTIDRDRGKPTNGEFIAIISNFVRIGMEYQDEAV